MSPTNRELREMQAETHAREYRACPSCGREFLRREIGGHKTHCVMKLQLGPAIWRKPRPERGRRGFLYLIETMEGPSRVKIGFADDVTARFKGLKVASPVELRLRAAWSSCTMAHEWDAHQAVRELWVHGEWFDGAAAEVVERMMDKKKERVAA